MVWWKGKDVVKDGVVDLSWLLNSWKVSLFFRKNQFRKVKEQVYYKMMQTQIFIYNKLTWSKSIINMVPIDFPNNLHH